MERSHTHIVNCCFHRVEYLQQRRSGWKSQKYLLSGPIQKNLQIPALDENIGDYLYDIKFGKNLLSKTHKIKDEYIKLHENLNE